MIEDQPDEQDQPVELGFPLGYALSWGFPHPPFPDLSFSYLCDFSYFLFYGNFFKILIFLKFLRVSDIFRVFQCFFPVFDYRFIFALRQYFCIFTL